MLAGFNQDRVDHPPPAPYFERHRDELLGQVDDATFESAANLFFAGNSQLRV